MPGTLGSTGALVGSTSALTGPPGVLAVRRSCSRTGSGATPFAAVGTLGYFQKDLLDKLFCVRARFYRPTSEDGSPWIRCCQGALSVCIQHAHTIKRPLRQMPVLVHSSRQQLA